jgi:hypothetical protein
VLFLGSLPPLALRLPPLSALLFGLSFLGVITAITQAFRAALPQKRRGAARFVNKGSWRFRGT